MEGYDGSKLTRWGDNHDDFSPTEEEHKALLKLREEISSPLKLKATPFFTGTVEDFHNTPGSFKRLWDTKS